MTWELTANSKIIDVYRKVWNLSESCLKKTGCGLPPTSTEFEEMPKK